MSRPRVRWALSATSRGWLVRALGALVAALLINASLSALDIEHDAVLITLLALAVGSAVTLAIQALDLLVQPTWTAHRPDRRPASGEDNRTAMFRHLVEVHQTSREVDDAVLWQLADLAAQRMRQVHGLRYAEDPDRATELLGPLLAGLVGTDRRERYRPPGARARYSVGQLEILVGRIEAL